VAFSRTAPDLVRLQDFVRTLSDDTPAVFVVGAMAHGKIDVSYVDAWVSVSEYPLSAACCIAKITNAFEDKWSIM
jgi:rRNA small subunit pseudouridine methyltransferase Nep1